MNVENAPWHLRRMGIKDIPQAETIRHLVGWNQTEADWLRLLRLAPDGCFVAESAGQTVGTVTTTGYASRLGWIGMLLVHPDHRRQGVGGGLLQRAMQHLQDAGVHSIALDATPAGQPLYAGAGFAPVWELARWQGSTPAHLPAAGPGLLTEIPDAAWPALIELDRRAFGVARSDLLLALAGQSNRVAVVLDPAGDLLAFGMLRQGTRAQLLGPLVAVDRASAAYLLAGLCAGLPQQAVYWDIPEPNTGAVALASALGFTRQRTLTRMVWGAHYPAHDSGLLYGVADLATG